MIFIKLIYNSDSDVLRECGYVCDPFLRVSVSSELNRRERNITRRRYQCFPLIQTSAFWRYCIISSKPHCFYSIKTNFDAKELPELSNITNLYVFFFSNEYICRIEISPRRSSCKCKCMKNP